MRRTLLGVGAAVGPLIGVVVGPAEPLGALGLAAGGACLIALLWSRGRSQGTAAADGPTSLWRALDAGLDPTDDDDASASDKLGADDTRPVIPPSQETR